MNIHCNSYCLYIYVDVTFAFLIISFISRLMTLTFSPTRALWGNAWLRLPCTPTKLPSSLKRVYRFVHGNPSLTPSYMVIWRKTILSNCLYSIICLVQFIYILKLFDNYLASSKLLLEHSLCFRLDLTNLYI